MPETNDLVDLERRIQKMCSKYASLKKENEKLRQQLQSSRELISTYNQEIDSLNNRLREVVLFNAVSLASGDAEMAKKTIMSMIKDIDKCIAHLYK